MLLGPLWAVLGRSGGLWRRSWGTPGASGGGPGASLEPLEAAAPGGPVGSPGPLLAVKWPFLEREQDPRGSRPPEPPRSTRSPPKAPVLVPIFSIDIVFDEESDFQLENKQILDPGGKI